MLIIQTANTGHLRFGSASAGLAFIFLATFCTPAMAEVKITPEMIRYASGIHLAFIKTTNPDLNQISQRGLEGLKSVLTQRTSVEPAGVIGLDPAQDELSFFPLIYWAIDPRQPPLSNTALQNIQNYLDHGGTIIFDTRDNNIGGVSSNTMHLRAMTSGLNIAPLVRAPDDHVLRRSFYLIQSFPGRFDNAALWIEEQSANGRDGVSSVIVGGNDWVSAWAGLSPAQGSIEQEMALRFGVNLVMYALTGNYKADQVHIPHILERLGQ